MVPRRWLEDYGSPCASRESGRWPAGLGLWEKLIERVCRRGPYSLGSRYFQLQAGTTGASEIDETSKEAIHELFLVCRERFRDHFAKAAESK